MPGAESSDAGLAQRPAVVGFELLGNKTQFFLSKICPEHVLTNDRFPSLENSPAKKKTFLAPGGGCRTAAPWGTEKNSNIPTHKIERETPIDLATYQRRRHEDAGPRRVAAGRSMAESALQVSKRNEPQQIELPI
jgi:hypothetical protein